MNAEQFPIRTVCALTGVKAITLRAWERRYGLICPARSATGHRLYSQSDIAQVRRVLALLDRGLQIGHVRDALTHGERPGINSSPAGPWPAYLDRMAAAIATFDEVDLDAIHDEVLTLYSIEQLTDALLLPALVRLGERWSIRPGGIAEEHFLAAYLRSKLGARLQRPSRYARGPKLLAACAPNEHHELGLLIFALEARSAGCRIILLGADNPLLELAAAQEHARCDALVISSSIATGAWLQEGHLPVLVRRVRVPVFVGGTTADVHRKELVEAGAIPLGSKPRNGLKILMATLEMAAVRRR